MRSFRRGNEMGAPIELRADFDAAMLRKLAKQIRDPVQCRRSFHVISSKLGNRLSISRGSNVPSQSQGISSAIPDISIRTVGRLLPLRRFDPPRRSSCSRRSSNATFRIRSANAFLKSSNKSRKPPRDHFPQATHPRPWVDCCKIILLFHGHGPSIEFEIVLSAKRGTRPSAPQGRPGPIFWVRSVQKKPKPPRLFCPTPISKPYNAIWTKSARMPPRRLTPSSCSIRQVGTPRTN